MKAQTSTLTGPALDWAVAKCEGLPLRLDPMGFRKDAPNAPQAGWWVWDGEGQTQIIGHRKMRRGDEDGYSPSTNWSQGGPIIEREGICLYFNPEDADAFEWHAEDRNHALYLEGPTPLIAAMRCLVASRLGNEVDVPEELT